MTGLERFSGSRRSARDGLVAALISLVLAGCPPPPPTSTGLPCDVAELVSKKCLSCHGRPLQDGAPMRLITHSDFSAKSMSDDTMTVAQRSLFRLGPDSPTPMPPAYAAGLTAEELAAFKAWVNAGAPAGDCETTLDAGLGYDAGPPPPTCTSGAHAPQPLPSNPHGGADMAPGWACRSCHMGQNFMGQNPGGALGMTVPFDVMGTVYGTLLEEDLCLSTVGDAGIVVEIFDSTGTKVITAPVQASGNFYGSVAADAGLKVPYSAQVVQGSKTRKMMATQTQQDCNQCHTAQGLMDAPGRILAP